MTEDIAISLQNVSKKYKLYDKSIDRLKESLHPLNKQYHKDFYALKDINLEVKKGEVLGIIGVNGAGKSTLLKIISGAVTASTGHVNVNGRLNAILELNSGLNNEMTGVENIRLHLQLNGVAQDKERLTKEIIEFAEIGEHINQPVKTYSSGMKSRLGFGIATSTNPDILIVDEVLAVGDVLFQRKCYSKIDKLFKDGKTVIFVSHNPQSVIQFCSRAVMLYDRKIIMDDAPKKVTDYYQKLVFSTDKQKVLDDVNNHKVQLKQTEQKQKETKKEVRKELERNTDSYLPDLKCKPDSINDHFFEFYDVLITNSVGNTVNLLDYSRYTASFKMKSKVQLSGVNVGMQIKNLSGYTLSGSSIKELLQPQGSIPEVHKNSIYKFNVEFDNLLLPGSYLISLFATSETGETSIQDNAYIFKTKKMAYKQGGVVTLNQSISYAEHFYE